MADNPEVLRHEIEETSESLKEKVVKLEEQVIGTVKGTTEAVGETVEKVKETVAETIDTVRETVQETVQTVKRTFDLRYQTEHHPWVMFGGSVAAGFLAGKLFGSWFGDGRNGHHDTGPSYLAGAAATSASRPSYTQPSSRPSYTPPSAPPPQPAAQPSRPGWFSRLWDSFGGELDKLKIAAIGTVFGLVRDYAKKSLPEGLAPKVEEVLNDLTVKLGGEPIHGPVMGRG